MDGFAFTIRILELLIWPATVLVVAGMFRKQLRELLPLLRRLKLKDIEVEFEKEVRTVSAKVEEELPRSPAPEPAANKTEEQVEDIRFSIRSFSPAEYVADGWFLLQRGVFDLLARCNFGAPGGLTAIEAARVLRSRDVLNEEHYQLFREMVLLANKLSHAEAEAVSDTVSRDFHSAAIRFEEFLSQLGPQQDREQA